LEGLINKVDQLRIEDARNKESVLRFAALVQSWMVEISGLEPLTSALQRQRSTN